MASPNAPWGSVLYYFSLIQQGFCSEGNLAKTRASGLDEHLLPSFANCWQEREDKKKQCDYKKASAHRML
jgi:hypothetical protein